MTSDHSAPSAIVYTSGTTGDPKGVILNNDGLNAIASQLKSAYQDKKGKKQY